MGPVAPRSCSAVACCCQPVRQENANVAELADRLGYRSEAAFARAFKRVIGVVPGAVKRDPRDTVFTHAA